MQKIPPPGKLPSTVPTDAGQRVASIVISRRQYAVSYCSLTVNDRLNEGYQGFETGRLRRHSQVELNANPDIEAIREQARKILAAGELGRSRLYAGLLEFLVNCAEQGRVPKELEIATEVFGRSSGFDPGQDSTVRVYAHNLRQKFKQYYSGAGSEETRQLKIPVGEYRLILEAAPAATGVTSDPRPGRKPVLAAVAVLLVAFGTILGLMISGRLASPPAAGQYAVAAASPLWQPILDDDLPILIVVGDYYIFGELDERGNLSRLVREFGVNSGKDLDDWLLRRPELVEQYMDLDLTYLPRGAAFALRDLLRVIYTTSKPVHLTSMSEVDAADFRDNHLIYIGYVSALDKLFDFVFASSELSVGNSFDELVNRSTGAVFVSEAGLPPGSRNYRDYGLFSTFPGPNGNQFMVVAGTRDAGLMQTAQELSDPVHLRVAEQAAVAEGFKTSQAVELLFEVTGFARTNLDAMIVHAAALDYQAIWGGELVPAD